jgi:hypothetical protein
MADVDIGLLPTVAEARAQQLARQPTPVASEVSEDERRRPASAPVDGLGWTDRAGLVAQERSAMKWVKAADRAGDAAEPPGEKKLRFFGDKNERPEPGRKPEAEDGEKKLKFFEDKRPDKDIDRDR